MSSVLQTALESAERQVKRGLFVRGQLQARYREIQELRELVREAEASALQRRNS